MTEPQPSAAAADQPEAAKNPLLRHTDLSFPVAEIDAKIDAALMQQRAKVSLPGFRRGKVPLSVLRQRYGKDTLEEVLRHECAERFRREMEENKERPAAAPHLQLPAVSSNGAYEVHCHYEVLPAIEPPDFSGKTLKKPEFAVDEAATDEMIDILRRQHGRYEAVDSAADDDEHRLRVDFESVLLPAAGSEEEEKVVESGADQPLLLGDSGLRAELREALRGARAGDVRSADLVVPPESPDESMRGRTVRMKVTVKKVEKLVLAELDEAFFSHFSDEDKTLESFQKSVRAHLERESKARLRNFLQTRAMNMLIAATPSFPMPQSLLFQECSRLYHSAQSEWQQRGMAKTAAQPSPQMFMPEAQRRVALGLILSAWQAREKPSIEKADLEARVQEIAAAYEDPPAAVAQIQGNSGEMEAVYLSILEDRVSDWVCEHCGSEAEQLQLNDFFGGVAQPR